MADNSFALSSFAGKIAIVSGAAQGVGEATARLFAAREIKGLLLTDRNPQVERVAESIRAQGIEVATVVADLAKLDEVQTIVPAAEKAFGRVDILANIAGNTERGTLLDTDPELYERIFAINVRAPFFLMQDAVKIMKSQSIHGAIVNILSVNAHGGSPNLSPYSASKGALLTLTKNTANALLWDRIRCNGIILGWVDTPGEHVTLKRFHDAPDNWLEEAEKSRPFGRLLKADDVARMVAFLASDESGIMTGSMVDFEQTVAGVTPFNPVV